jgi:hypothetical protein
VIADDEVLFFGTGATKKNVRVGKTGGFQAGGGSFGDRSGGTSREAGGNLDELLVDIAGKLFFSVGARGLGGHSGGEEECEYEKEEAAGDFRHAPFFHGVSRVAIVSAKAAPLWRHANHPNKL